ncbi:MAG: hypothetical protein IPI32_15100 [Austwickia sp.]|jgi:hypothetical protein|nr:hypothetical protein [Austwickia sp.]MBK8435506.1 hypothetical protein [Austwickia sp.]MBK9100922.1 hypothetical protein [Austwickia sp.]
MLTRELFADALQQAATAGSVVHDRAHAELVAELCLRLFETQSDVAAEIQRTGGGRPTAESNTAASAVDVPDIRVYDSAEHAQARRGGPAAIPLTSAALSRMVRARRQAPGDAA